MDINLPSMGMPAETTNSGFTKKTNFPMTSSTLGIVLIQPTRSAQTTKKLKPGMLIDVWVIQEEIICNHLSMEMLQEHTNSGFILLMLVLLIHNGTSELKESAPTSNKVPLFIMVLKNTLARAINLVSMVIQQEITTSGSILKALTLLMLTSGTMLASTHTRYAHTMMNLVMEHINARVTPLMEIRRK